MRAPSSERRRVVLFDGVCVLCDVSMRRLFHLDSKGVLSFAPLQGETAAAVLARHRELDDRLRTVVYVRDLGTPEEAVFIRSDAAAAILEDLGGLCRCLSWFRLVPRPLRDGLYDFVAARRYRWFGRLDACRLPAKGMESRILP